MLTIIIVVAATHAGTKRKAAEDPNREVYHGEPEATDVMIIEGEEKKFPPGWTKVVRKRITDPSRTDRYYYSPNGPKKRHRTEAEAKETLLDNPVFKEALANSNGNVLEAWKTCYGE